jgi:RecQ family ATP-dependent DNA helicase
MTRDALGNMPFKASDQKTTLAGNSRMFARLLCSVVRTIEQRHKWHEKYPFDNKQKAAAQELREAIEKEEVDDDEVKEAIHRLGLALFCKKRRNISKGDFACPVYRFLVISSIKEGGSFMQESDITNIIAKLQWTCRAMIYEEMLRKMETMTEKQAWKKLGKFVKEGRYTAFNSIRQVLHLASAIAYGTSGMPQIEWLDDDHVKASINGKAVELDDIQRFVLDRVEAAKTVLEKEILLGHKFEEFGYTCGKIMDMLRNTQIGYSFIDSGDNGFVKFKDKLMEMLLNDSLIKGQFIKRVRGGKVEWNKDGCKRWLKATRAFLEKMAVSIHIGYGQPARAEELATVMIKNQVNGMRGIYWSRGQLMIVIGYNKTRSTNGKDKLIARFLPEEVGDLLVKYLTLVRPAEAFIAEQIECDGFENYEKMLFTDYERAWDGKRLSEIFMREMNESGPASMGFQEYRQIANLWMKKHLKEIKLEEDVLDHQAGHNSETAEARYGITSEDMDKLTPEKLLGFFHASQQWHRLLGFKVRENEIKGKIKDQVKAVTDENKNLVNQEEITSMVKSGIETGLREVRRNFRTRRFKEENRGSSTTASVSSKSLKTLRKFYGNKQATFKSPQQAKALQLVIDGRKDVLAILPTGGGKSLLFFLPTLMEPGMTTVVIVPLIAVTDDLRDRCVKANISCANWDPHSRYREQCNLLFVAVEHAVEPAFLNHLQIMHGMGILKRIVMDEAHVSLTHRDFRPDMEKLVIVMRTVPVQVLLLTATMPPSMELDLRIALACSVWEVIRAETTRPEIGYEVVEVNEEEFKLDVEIAFRIKKEMREWSRDRNGVLNGNERGIVYCLQKDWAKDLCEFLNKEMGEDICDVYHADLSKEVRMAVYREWQEGTVKILVATSALGLGIDYGHVRFVIHQGQSRSLIDFSQESGRAGRDGKEAHSIIFTSKEMRQKCEWIEKKESEWAGHLTGGFKAMKEWVAGKTMAGIKECRRVGLGLYMDGKGTNCLSLGDCVWCDVCEEAMGKSTETESESESEIEDEDEIEGSEIEGSEMDIEEHEWSQSTIDGLEENVMVADAEGQWQVDTAIKIREMMSVFYKRCVLCWVNKISAKHELSDCKEMPGKCSRCQSKGHSVRRCVPVRYTGGNCCWKCGLPQKLGRVHIHGEMSIGACETGYMDKMFPLCWYLWLKTSWKRRLEAHFRQEWSEDEFREWICRIDRGLTNGVRVMLWVWDEIENK